MGSWWTSSLFFKTTALLGGVGSKDGGGLISDMVKGKEFDYWCVRLQANLLPFAEKWLVGIGKVRRWTGKWIWC